MGKTIPLKQHNVEMTSVYHDQIPMRKYTYLSSNEKKINIESDRIPYSY